MATAMTSDMVLLQTAITLYFAVGILTGVATAQSQRARPVKAEIASSEPGPADGASESQALRKIEPSILIRRLKVVWEGWRQWFRGLGVVGVIRVSTAVAGALVLLSVAMFTLPQNRPTPLLAGVIAGGCLLAAGLAVIAARYLGQIDALELPEARPSVKARGSSPGFWVWPRYRSDWHGPSNKRHFVSCTWSCSLSMRPCFTGYSRRGSPPAGFKRASH